MFVLQSYFSVHKLIAAALLWTSYCPALHYISLTLNLGLVENSYTGFLFQSAFLSALPPGFQVLLILASLAQLNDNILFREIVHRLGWSQPSSCEFASYQESLCLFFRSKNFAIYIVLIFIVAAGMKDIEITIILPCLETDVPHFLFLSYKSLFMAKK